MNGSGRVFILFGCVLIREMRATIPPSVYSISALRSACVHRYHSFTAVVFRLQSSNNYPAFTATTLLLDSIVCVLLYTYPSPFKML